MNGELIDDQMEQTHLKNNCEVYAVRKLCNMVSVSYLIYFYFKILLFGLMLTDILSYRFEKCMKV
jgi:hypothetical protein